MSACCGWRPSRRFEPFSRRSFYGASSSSWPRSDTMWRSRLRTRRLPPQSQAVLQRNVIGDQLGNTRDPNLLGREARPLRVQPVEGGGRTSSVTLLAEHCSVSCRSLNVAKVGDTITLVPVPRECDVGVTERSKNGALVLRLCLVEARLRLI